MLHEEILLATATCNCDCNCDRDSQLQLQITFFPNSFFLYVPHILYYTSYILYYTSWKLVYLIRYTNFQNVKTLMDEFFTFAGSLSWLWIWISSLIHLGRWNSSRWTKFHYDSTCLKLLNIIPYSLHGCLAQETQQFFVVPSIDRWCMLSYFLYSRAHTLGNLPWRYVFSIK